MYPPAGSFILCVSDKIFF